MMYVMCLFQSLPHDQVTDHPDNLEQNQDMDEGNSPTDGAEVLLLCNVVICVVEI